MINFEEELKLLKEWKDIYKSPEHMKHNGDFILYAQLGELPNIHKKQMNKAFLSYKLEEIGFLGWFPLIVISHNTKSGESEVLTIVNPRFQDRTPYTDYVKYKMGFYPKNYYEEYQNGIIIEDY